MKWKLLPQKNDDIIESLLLHRGIKTALERQHFFHPEISDFSKDLKIPSIKKSQQRLQEAIKNQEQIVIFGDYDVDGICATAILYKALVFLGGKVLPYIPHREKEGYGLSKLGLDFAKKNNAKVVITVDCGIVAFEQATYAKNLGIDLIITDHHLVSDKLPDAYEIVHSTKMCGAAVAWCMISGIIKEELQKELLQFVAIATVCDLMPLVNLNRAFVVEGLKVLNATTNLGLLALFNECGISMGQISSFEIGYILGPRLNAIGRLEHAIDALRLLCTKDPTKAKVLSKLLCETNSRRQNQTIQAVQEAKLMVQPDQNIQVLHSKNWPSGIIGLIAGKITEEYFRPAIAISWGETISKGSARSIDGVNIVEIIRKHADILIDIGGHPGAAGFSILSENIKILQQRLTDHKLDLADEKVLEIDALIQPSQIDKKLLNDLQKFEPFGFKNPKPIFASYKVKVSNLKTVGAGKHLKFQVSSPVIPNVAKRSEGSIYLDCIAFGMGELEKNITNGQLIDLAFTPEIDRYNGFEKIQLKVKDIKFT